MPLTTAMIARAMPAAIRPYSIAVAPDSSDKNFEKTFFKLTSRVLICAIGSRFRAGHHEFLA
jgi:hypothetical protein